MKRIYLAVCCAFLSGIFPLSAADETPVVNGIRKILLETVTQEFRAPFDKPPVKTIYFDVKSPEDIAVYQILKSDGWTIYQPIGPFLTTDILLQVPAGKRRLSGTDDLKNVPLYKSRFYLQYVCGGSQGNGFFSVMDLSTEKLFILFTFRTPFADYAEKELPLVLNQCIKYVCVLDISIAENNKYAIQRNKFSSEDALGLIKATVQKYKNIATLQIRIPFFSPSPEQLKDMDLELNKSKLGGTRPATLEEAKSFKEKIEALNAGVEVVILPINEARSADRRRITLATEQK